MNSSFIIVDEGEHGLRVDKYLAHKLDIPRAQVTRLISNGFIKLNGDKLHKGSKTLKEGDDLVVDQQSKPSTSTRSRSTPIKIIHDSSDYMIIDKPMGLLVHKINSYTADDTVVEQVKHLVAYDDGHRSGIVHRLDRFTSGVMIIAKTLEFKDHINQQFQQREVGKHYLAVVDKPLKNPKLTIDAPIERNPKLPSTFRVGANGKPAITNIIQRSIGEQGVLLDVFPQSGRTHQIRVHLKHIDRAIMGDRLYGGGKSSRLMLHSYEVNFKNIQGDSVTYKSLVPKEFDIK